MSGILLINLGTPNAPTTTAVRQYLREFLKDPYVIDINPIGRWLLVNFIIAPFRSPKSAKAYREVWMEEGSPLLVYSEQLQDKLHLTLANDIDVVLGMRYGNPSIESAVQKLRDHDHIIVIPLYPQYANASSKTAIEAVCIAFDKHHPSANITFLPSFYDHPEYIKATAAVAQEALSDFQFDHLLMSYHGLPVRQLPCAHDTVRQCVSQEQVCPDVSDQYPLCYRAHCYATSRELAAALSLSDDQWSVSFQSRLGRTPWIKPYTDFHIPILLEQGIKRLAVISPSFVADCLETVEEIGIRLRQQFMAGGGKSFCLIPSLNDHDVWVEALQEMITEHRSKAIL